MPDSEDEFALLNEVDILVTKIKARPEIHFDAETDADIRKRIRANESLEVRLTKWQSRLTNLQKLLNAGSSGLSGGPPAASVVATSCAPAVSTGRRKRTCSPLRRPTLASKKHDDGSPPEMADPRRPAGANACKNSGREGKQVGASTSKRDIPISDK